MRNCIPGLGQTRAKLYTLFRTERTKTIRCPAAHPRIGHIRENPPRDSSIKSILHLSIHLSYLEESFCLDTICSAELPKSGVFLFIYASVKRHKYVKFKTGTTNIN